MSLRSEERALRREHRQLLNKRRRAIERRNFTWAQRRGIEARRVKQRIQSVHRRRVGTFRPSLLGGHPGNIDDACKRLIALADKFARARGYYFAVTATTDGVHALHSWHNPTPLGHAVDLIFSTVEQMEEFQNYVVAHTPRGAGDFHEVFGPAAFYVKEGDVVAAHFPGHADHDHVAPKASYRR